MVSKISGVTCFYFLFTDAEGPASRKASGCAESRLRIDLPGETRLLAADDESVQRPVCTRGICLSLACTPSRD